MLALSASFGDAATLWKWHMDIATAFLLQGGPGLPGGPLNLNELEVVTPAPANNVLDPEALITFYRKRGAFHLYGISSLPTGPRAAEHLNRLLQQDTVSDYQWLGTEDPEEPHTVAWFIPTLSPALWTDMKDVFERELPFLAI